MNTVALELSPGIQPLTAAEALDINGGGPQEVGEAIGEVIGEFVRDVALFVIAQPLIKRFL